MSLSKNWQKISALSSLSESLCLSIIFRPIICLSTETPNRSIGSVLTSVTKGGRYGKAENLNFLERLFFEGHLNAKTEERLDKRLM